MSLADDHFHVRYDYHDDYYSINTGAHRKGGIELSTPTLTNHLGLWFPRVGASDQTRRTVERFGKLVDSYIGAIYLGLRRQEHFESNFEFDLGTGKVVGLFGGAYSAGRDELKSFEVHQTADHFAIKDALESDNRILFAKADCKGLRVIVRCEFHSEFFTITRFVTVTEIGDLPNPLGDLQKHLSALAELACRGDDAKLPADSEISANHIFLYQTIWDLVDKHLFRAPGLFAATTGKNRSQIFADFRGLVFTGDDTAPLKTITTENFKGDAKGNRYSSQWPHTRLMPSVWPFLTAKDGLDLKRREFTASFMLGRRAVYVTALGPQPPAITGLQCAPLNYFLVARPMNDWQLGALVDRLHYMGTVRLAALMELSALRKAGANLRDMEHDAEAARAALDANDTETAQACYLKIMQQIAHIDKQRRPIFWAGLQFRVERSRYYVQRFYDFVPFLEIEQIPGYQRYDHFVKGRLGGVYDYINRLGFRQQRATTSATSIFQSILLKDGAITNKTIEQLQTKAEIALLAVIVPHYLMEIVHNYQEQVDRHYWVVVKWFIAISVIGVALATLSGLSYAADRVRRNGLAGLEEIAKKVFFWLILSLFIAFVVMQNV